MSATLNHSIENTDIMSFKDTIADSTPDPVLRVIQPIYYGIFGPFYRLADTYGLIGPDEIYDEDYYAKRKKDPWRSDAHAVAEAIERTFDPESVIDFGCAIGAHLEPFHERGVVVRGVEGNSSAIEHAVIPEGEIKKHDLREPYETPQDYDLAICIEVAEHLPEKFADTLVDSLTSASETVVMTAAPPGQYGTHHVNLQPRDYWIQKFEERGFTVDERAGDELRSEIEVEETDWVNDNLFVFRKGGE